MNSNKKTVYGIYCMHIKVNAVYFYRLYFYENFSNPYI